MYTRDLGNGSNGFVENFLWPHSRIIDLAWFYFWKMGVFKIECFESYIP